MPVTRERPPLRVCAAFNVDPESLRPLADGSGWRGDGVVLRPATDSVEAVWAARALGSIVLPDVRIARPSRATDGRAIVGGWMAYRLAAGSGDEVAEERPSVEEIVLVSVKLHQALINVPRPDFIDKRTDVLARADRVAWGEEEVELDEANGGRWFEILAGAARETKLPNQVVHGSLFRSVRLAGDRVPTVFDFRPYYRPAEWATALVVVDAVVANAAGATLIQQWSHLPDWRQMLLRATMFRLAAHALDPESAGEETLDGLRRAAVLVGEV
ncbi:TIGR02569 family protein [Thermocrispum agreste]|uniref:TIGR02569 family protein n=1 Tax=Thermocrispum agreste TaxID=37925 RepID=UPI0004908089|nr:TIGR02569 family protein [Thermocrispum agreste]